MFQGQKILNLYAINKRNLKIIKYRDQSVKSGKLHIIYMYIYIYIYMYMHDIEIISGNSFYDLDEE